MTRGLPSVRVSTDARWTLNAFAGGYCRDTDKQGLLAEFAMEGPYRTLMEGIESFAGLMKSANIREDEPLHYATAADGRRYISSLAVRRA